jgi:hypothetical protein
MRKFITVIILMFLLLTIDYGLLTANAAVPHLLSYQGRLTDSSGSPLNGLYNITFRIYDAETAGNLLWQGTYTSISITKGIFNILLGDVSDTGFNFTNLAFDKPYWLEIKVGTDNPMQPRQRITSAGHAIRAEKAERLTDASAIDSGTIPTTRLGSGTPNSSTFLRGDQSWQTITSSLRTYDSGARTWVAGTAYNLTHNLGTTKLLIQVYFRPSSNYNWEICASHRDDGYMSDQRVILIDNNNISIWSENLFSKQTNTVFGSGQFRVIILALE